MKLLPRDAERVIHVDVPETLKALEDQRDARDDLEDEWEDLGLSDTYDIDIRDLDSIASGETDDGDWVFLLAGLDLEDLRDALDDEDYDEDEIGDVEVWINTSYRWEAFAFLDGSALIADDEDVMEDMLRRRERGSSSYHDEAGDFWSDVPAGAGKYITTDCDSYCLFYGYSFARKGSDEFELVAIGEYDDDDRVDLIYESWEDDEISGCDGPQMKQSGMQVRQEYDCDIDVLEDFRWDLRRPW